MSKATGKLRQDKFYRLAKEQGYRSRAAMKLLQLDRSFSFLPTARAVLDLGAAPGGWVQVAVTDATAGALVVGVDLKPIWPIRGARLLREDITATARCSAAVRRLMDSKGVTAFDVVLHDGIGRNNKRKRDGAHKTTRQSALVIDAVRLATMFLAPKGTFITKFIGPHDFTAIMFCLNQLFEKVQVAKLEASRSMLPEHYFVCLEYKAPAKIQLVLFDLNHMLNASLKNKPRDEVRNSMETKSRGITMHGSFPSWKAWNAGRALDFIWSEAQTMQELLVSFMGVSFEDPESLPIKNHELTTEEIQMFCENLDIQDKKNLKSYLGMAHAHKESTVFMFTSDTKA
ncbi:pre-rRNA 2'-O-ribose RNA methyltransferase FTSJ3-like [Lolium rigidum]|uniref:pre-rRNA 2'-O-ribose RNA methyltransferase FTSJ3-like n=1 Tax=Lolium rigidum TaxID=89674 RepID=UPI001F5CA96C|nr:pre-rRNA 2'-O-ribose RNA methyltransferase FTSJ3-like [Lolium rigidum]